MAFVVTHRLTGIARARSASMLRAGRLLANKLHARSRLTPQERATLRAAAPTTAVIADGFSCRTQIAQGSLRRALHLAEVLAAALD